MLGPGALEIEVVGTPAALAAAEVERLVALALASAGIEDGHVAVEFVGSGRIRELNREWRGKDEPTDVLSFPIDGDGELGSANGLGDAIVEPAGAPPRELGDGVAHPAGAPPRELGDVVIAPDHTRDLREAVVHGALHLAGMDHETDDGEMLALQRELLTW